MTEVVAALIWEGDRFLACQRPPDKARGLLWEFVGGKVEPGETPEEALKREIEEELAAAVTVGRHFMTVEHRYDDFHLHLSCYFCTLISPKISLTEHADARWVDRYSIGELDWLPADLTLIEALQAQWDTIDELSAPDGE